MWLSPSHEIKIVSTRLKSVWKSTIAMDGTERRTSELSTGPLPRSTAPRRIRMRFAFLSNFIVRHDSFRVWRRIRLRSPPSCRELSLGKFPFASGIDGPGDGEGEDVRGGESGPGAVHAEKRRECQRERRVEQQRPEHREEKGEPRAADALVVCRDHRLGAGEGYPRRDTDHAGHAAREQRPVVREDSQHLAREDEQEDGAGEADGGRGDVRERHAAQYAAVVFGAVVVTDERQQTVSHAEHRHNNEREQALYESGGGDADRAAGVGEYPVEHGPRYGDAHLPHEGGGPDGEDPREQRRGYPAQALRLYRDGAFAAEIIVQQPGKRAHLRDDGGPGRARQPPFEDEDEERVQRDVDARGDRHARPQAVKHSE
ncbi:hypothetical protein SDC9_128095 [bioreactor metagenome]|uniref:Uncharacterized protein n=1 Tax=bioreactor metagenome TaxID=1076179 RepID=A0A645CVY6_9ZZZZ